MAIQTTEFAPSLRARVDAIFARIGRGMSNYVEVRSRHKEIEALEALSDKQLADMGISRDRIVHYVFRDLVWM